MVIVGGGASYDSPPEFHPAQEEKEFGHGSGAPPQTFDFFRDRHSQFGDIIKRYPRLSGILPFLRQPQGGRSIEEQLELYQNESSTDSERIRQLLSVRYYVHDLFHLISENWLKETSGVTNYATLIDQIRHRNTTGEPVCLVTFNYDLLLDRAVFPFGLASFPIERHFDAHKMFKVFKPHGSVDWARLAGPRQQLKENLRAVRLAPQQLIERADDFAPTGDFVRANATNPHQIFQHEAPIFPAIAIPVQTKTEDFFEWPDSHRKYFEELLPQIKRILIIGWQGKEAHFLQLLRAKLRTGGVTQLEYLQVVGKEYRDATEIAKNVNTAIHSILWRAESAPQGFSHYVREELVDFFFQAGVNLD